MAEKFDIVIEPQRGLLRIVMRGHWDVETVREYKAAVLGAVGKLRSAGCAPGDVVALVDIRDAGAQSQDVIGAYKDDWQDPGLIPRRLATVVTSALFKRQVERIAIPNQRFFTDEVEALSWLLSSDAVE